MPLQRNKDIIEKLKELKVLMNICRLSNHINIFIFVFLNAFSNSLRFFLSNFHYHS